MASNIVLATQEFNVVGTRPIRHDGTEKVTGQARYGADIHLPGMLHGRILRSPHAHARIKGIDPSRALALPGVKAVVTGADMPEHGGRVMDLGEGAMTNTRFLSNNCMATEKALYKGHAVAAVAATSGHIAEEAQGELGAKDADDQQREGPRLAQPEVSGRRALAAQRSWRRSAHRLFRPLDSRKARTFSS